MIIRCPAEGIAANTLYTSMRLYGSVRQGDQKRSGRSSGSGVQTDVQTFELGKIKKSVLPI